MGEQCDVRCEGLDGQAEGLVDNRLVIAPLRGVKHSVSLFTLEERTAVFVARLTLPLSSNRRFNSCSERSVARPVSAISSNCDAVEGR